MLINNLNSQRIHKEFLVKFMKLVEKMFFTATFQPFIDGFPTITTINKTRIIKRNNATKQWKTILSKNAEVNLRGKNKGFSHNETKKNFAGHFTQSFQPFIV